MKEIDGFFKQFFQALAIDGEELDDYEVPIIEDLERLKHKFAWSVKSVTLRMATLFGGVKNESH